MPSAKAAAEGVRYLTLFGFSSENWKRPSDEISGLMGLVVAAVSKYLARMGSMGVQIRIIGEATRPQALPYRQNMTLLDVMILVGGLTQFADGNEAKIVRVVEGQQQQYRVRIDDLLKDGDITANVDMLPGDILIVPESWL